MERKMRRRLRILVVMAVLMIGCIGTKDVSRAASKITLKSGAAAPSSIYTGKSYTLKVAGTAVKFYSNKKAVATIGLTTGKLKATAPGSVKITAKSKKTGKAVASKSFKVLQRATSVSLSEGKMTLNEGETANVNAWKTPSTSTDVLKFFSSDKTVATVGQTSGKITAVSEGSATITVYSMATKATSKTSKYNKTATLELTVLGGTALLSAEQTDVSTVEVKFAKNLKNTDPSQFVVKTDRKTISALSVTKGAEEGVYKIKLAERLYLTSKYTLEAHLSGEVVKTKKITLLSSLSADSEKSDWMPGRILPSQILEVFVEYNIAGDAESWSDFETNNNWSNMIYSQDTGRYAYFRVVASETFQNISSWVNGSYGKYSDLSVESENTELLTIESTKIVKDENGEAMLKCALKPGKNAGSAVLVVKSKGEVLQRFTVTVYEKQTVASLELDKSSVVVPQGGHDEVRVRITDQTGIVISSETTAAAVSLISNVDWITLDGDGVISVNPPQDTEAGSYRVVLTMKDDDKVYNAVLSVLVRVQYTEEAQPKSVTLDTTRVIMEQGETRSIGFKVYNNLSLQITELDASCLHFTESCSWVKAGTDGKIVLTPDLNTESREYQFTFYYKTDSGDCKKTFSVIVLQKPEATPEPAPSYYPVESFYPDKTNSPEE